MSADGSDVTPADEQAELMRLLSAAVEDVDPVPASALRFAMESRRLIAFEAELAEIVSDSFVEAAATRSSTTVRTVVFQAGDATIRIEVDDSGIAGSISPVDDEAILRLQRVGDEVVDVTVNERGFFFVEGITGRVRFALEADGSRVVSDWVQLQS